MPDTNGTSKPGEDKSLGRRSFLQIFFGGVVAAVSGWVAGAFPRPRTSGLESAETDTTEERIAALEQQVAELTNALAQAGVAPPLAQLEGENNRRIIFYKKELSVINPDGVLLNLVATDGGVGIRFYKDNYFGDEQNTNPWHMGWIEGLSGYQGLAILRDWAFTAALWDEDGKLLVGRLDPYPPGNAPAEARFHVRGTMDEVQALVEARADQRADVFQVIGGAGSKCLSVNNQGEAVIGSRDDPQSIVLYDTANGNAYRLSVTDGRLALSRV